MKHEYETYEKAQTKLKTCNSAAKVFVSHHQPPQEVVAGGEIIFTYDVKFEVKPISYLFLIGIATVKYIKVPKCFVRYCAYLELEVNLSCRFKFTPLPPLHP